MHGYVTRGIEPKILELLNEFPVVAILGARQTGKSTTVQVIAKELGTTDYLDLERPSDRAKLREPELYLISKTDRLVCLDEIQRLPDLFPVLRSMVDENRRNGLFLVLGSASRDLIKQSSETLAGRIAFLEMTPFLLEEIQTQAKSLEKRWLRGGFPRSFLAKSNAASFRWLENFILTFLERDIPQMGFNIPAETIGRLWQMLAHNHGQMLNNATLGRSLGYSHTTIRSYVDLLSQTFMVRILKPLEANLKKRLVKSPKVYLRDSGILHSLLDIDSMDSLLGHPVVGHSWEGFIIEEILSTNPKWQGSFYRTSNGVEIDLVLSRGMKKIAVECKATLAPTLGRGFWASLSDLNIDEAWIVAPVQEPYPVEKGVTVAPLSTLLKRLSEIESSSAALS